MRSGVFTITCTDRDCDSRSPNPCVSAINSSRNRNLCSKTCDTVEQTCVLWRLTLRSMTVIPWANLPATRNLMRLRQCCRLYSLFYAGVVVISSMAAFAQIQPDPCATATTQAGDVSVRLSLKNGQTVFREGEIFLLPAEYSSSSAKKYYLLTHTFHPPARFDGTPTLCFDPIS